MRTVKNTEIRLKNGRRAILDTCELYPDYFETMLLYPGDGEEITSATASTEAQAIADFERIRSDYEFTGLTGKYAKLAKDLKQAAKAGIEAGKALGNDGGACNFDAPEIYLPRWRTSLVESAARDAGVGCFRCDMTGAYVFSLRSGFQGNANTKAAETARDVLAAAGYDANVFYRID